MREFAIEGVGGARTDAIARAAKVNKALLYYYFKDKESLFGAVMESVFAELTTAINQALSSPLPPKERFLAYVRAHFDFVASSPLRPRLFHREITGAGLEGSQHLRNIVQHHLRPIFAQVAALLQEGIEAGDFRPVNPAHFIPSVVGTIVFYFSTPIPKMVTGIDPYDPKMIEQRRAEVIDFVSAALFREPSGRNANRGARK